jgi:hypothetical protein
MAVKNCRFGSATMRIKLSLITPLLAVAVAATPVAGAASGASCNGSGAGTVCQSRGNVQINDNPPPVSFYP